MRGARDADDAKSAFAEPHRLACAFTSTAQAPEPTQGERGSFATGRVRALRAFAGALDEALERAFDADRASLISVSCTTRSTTSPGRSASTSYSSTRAACQADQ